MTSEAPNGDSREEGDREALRASERASGRAASRTMKSDVEPADVPRHELAGLRVEVVDSPSADYVGIAGEVVDETTNTLLVATDDGTKQVPKAAATFAFTVDGSRVIVEGERLVARPARRTENTGTHTWR